MNYLPNEITLSTKVTHKFSYIKQKIGVTPNIMARVALLKALEANVAPDLLETPESLSQKIPKDIAFGEYGDIFNFAINKECRKFSHFSWHENKRRSVFGLHSGNMDGFF